MRVTYEEYVVAVALTLARRHRPVWSWKRWRRVCRCGAELPCRARHRIPIRRAHWPGEDGGRPGSGEDSRPGPGEVDRLGAGQGGRRRPGAGRRRGPGEGP
ncbi:hypothetical protein GA0070558_115101 [Micromonospora haikouensis]|uniref:Uncharacterized protein n=1 Tax=Micromonospora haikouensis TaxID=686309 RepID=A0A1C4WGA5_9ACTN|nr:hypothetical protein [Micromonospora haikouensis]SCE95286.1 hypothetical protein GA0070558_115101 [Micromonospora haikouensis]